MSIINENIAQNSPATATVVNFGVSFFHLNETENIENPTAEAIPNKTPIIELLPVFSQAIIDRPAVAIIIANQTTF